MYPVRHEPRKNKVSDSNDRSAHEAVGRRLSGNRRSGDEKKYVEENAHYQQSYETATRCYANRELDRMRPITTGKEEERVGENTCFVSLIRRHCIYSRALMLCES